MARDTSKASDRGIEILKKAIKRKKGGQTYVAGAAGCSRQTIWSLLQGNPIDRDVFGLVCNTLDLNWQDIAEPEAPEPDTDLVLDELVREAREKVRADIRQHCGEMKVLDMTQSIDLDTIYTDVNILRDITGRQRLEIKELLTRCNFEEFDCLGFTHVERERRSGLETVEEFDKLLLLGKPGAGKTTFLKRLAMLCNAGTFQSHQVPIFISLKEFSDSAEKPKLLPYIDRQFQDRGIRQPNTAEQILKRGRGFLLLDGLDEVRESNSEWIVGEIQRFSERFSDNAFVMSCRIAAKEFTFQSFTEVEVADFTDEQIADFATRWFRAKELPHKPKEFLEQLESNPRIKELATNPLLLTLLCLVFEDRTDFPLNRSELYKEGLDVLLKKWDGKRGIRREEVYRELSLKRKEDMLSQLAYNTFESGNYFFKQREAEDLIESYIQNLPGAETDPEALRLDSEAVLKSIEAQHGLLVERARGIYSFSHLTFHEYLTARYIEQDDKLHSVLISHLIEKRWREVILLTVGMVRNANSLLLMMKSRVDGMLANDKKLQEYLTWVDRKTRAVNLSYKPAAIRAFYYSLDLDRPLIFFLDRPLIFSLDRPLIFSLDRSFSRFLLRSLDLPRLERSLQELRNTFPDPQNDNNHFQQWWRDHGSAWRAKLRKGMIEHRDIGHDWQFSEAQKELLRQYYNANKFLVDCLNRDCYVSRSIREEIEASLLLPVAQIQEQFPNQYRALSE